MLRLISYLAPSIPHGFFELLAKVISEGTGMDVHLEFNEQISGPLEGDENPFADDGADIGFVCAPTFRWLKEDLQLLPVPVPADTRANGKPVYFADVVVQAGSPFLSFDDLRGQRWAYNDRNSRSGWFSMLDRIAPHSPLDYFSEVVQSGSHLESLRWVMMGQTDAAAIDSNALLNQVNRNLIDASEFTILETWGPFPIQPVVIRADMPFSLKQSVHNSLLRAHEAFSSELNSFGFTLFTEARRQDYEG
jgi:ABC-type phosphate/phosphonate transport system substrate-binding protein